MEVLYATCIVVFQIKILGINPSEKHSKPLNDVLRAIPFWLLPLLTFGEDALFIPAFITNKFQIKLLLSIVFGLLHYLGGGYTLASALLKIPSTFALLYLHKHLVNFSIGHWLLDYIAIKIATL